MVGILKGSIGHIITKEGQEKDTDIENVQFGYRWRQVRGRASLFGLLFGVKQKNTVVDLKPKWIVSVSYRDMELLAVCVVRKERGSEQMNRVSKEGSKFQNGDHVSVSNGTKFGERGGQRSNQSIMG